MKSEILMQAYKEMRNQVQVNSDNRSLKREYFKNEITQQKVTSKVLGTSLINRR